MKKFFWGESGPKRLCDAVKDKSRLLKSDPGPLPVYVIPLEKNRIDVDGCKHFSYGKSSTKHNRTIMVLGATGAGKSTLINGMINYILGVQFEDSYRFKLVDEDASKSQTSEVTVYKLNHEEGFTVPFSLTIVDTPGFGDTRGIDRDREIVEQLRNLFSSDFGITEIDAVCFVAQASLAHLTATQKYVFDSVLPIFAKDVAENIRILVTFADGQRPPVLEAINASGVPCPKSKGLPIHFKFNNSALFADNQSSAANNTGGGEDGGFDKMFWDMGSKSMKRFFNALNVINTKSLKLTKEVLRERQQLEVSIKSLQTRVKLGLAKMEEINETEKQLKYHEAEISRNKNFEIYVTVKKPQQEVISGTGIYLTNCQQCHFTCHYPCGIPNDDDKSGCSAMGSDGRCKQCPGKCHWSVHFNQKYKWSYEEVQEKRTIGELKQKYQKAKGEKISVEGIIHGLKAHYNQMQTEVVKLISWSANCLNRLKEIALKPNPLSTPEYIDMLIEGEKSEGKPGFKERVNALMAMKEKAEFMTKVSKGENPLESSQQTNKQTNQQADVIPSPPGGGHHDGSSVQSVA
uniref:Septin-type G domain-containing protein n=1 Tax=Salarias fasciatus TaxID=181472 RepID=A0A672ILA4_SALFA